MTNQASAAGPPTPVEHLESGQCWDLLRQVSVGRLAVWIDDHPDIFPLNYTVDHGTVVFRTDEGTKLGGALGETPVALEADGVDADSGMAWSVVVKGKAAAINGTEEILDSASLYLFPWQAGRKDHFVRITPDTITGRRFKVTPPLTW
jgi:nitroimidazol reductase NimA-like FMN-containing flavoprotein (pyridoxamine 5'-phosphate oxidase superfamily)